jgi:hypothetical protein
VQVLAYGVCNRLAKVPIPLFSGFQGFLADIFDSLLILEEGRLRAAAIGEKHFPFLL